MGQTDVVIDEAEEGDEEEDVCEEWHDGVLRADKPAERAMWSNGTDGRDKRLL